MDYFTYRAGKIMERLDELSSCSDESGIISRTFGTAAFQKAQQKIRSWMDEAGMETRVDNIGNVRGRKSSLNAEAKTFVIASHFDTVINAGKFDGPLGVVMAIDLVESLVNITPLPYHVEVVAFSDEEGVRFHSTFLGSRVVAGAFDMNLLETQDSAGRSMKEVIEACGGDTNKIANDAISADQWLGYYEIHIEQGPVLYESGEPIAVVTGIAGQKRVMIKLTGMAGHAGTVPMGMRQDALCCAAEMISAIEEYGLKNKEELVATVGKLEIKNAATNVIPGEVSFALDVRSADSAVLLKAYEYYQLLLAGIAKKRNVEVSWQLVQETPPVSCDKDLSVLLASAMSSCGFKEAKLVSGAGHDAMAIAEVAPVSMLFVRCYKGISHNPLEDVEIKDIAAAIQVSDTFITLLAEKYNKS